MVNTAKVDLERPMVAMCNRGFTAAATAGLLQILGVDIPIYHVSFRTKRRFLTKLRVLLKSHLIVYITDQCNRDLKCDIVLQTKSCVINLPVYLTVTIGCELWDLACILIVHYFNTSQSLTPRYSEFNSLHVSGRVANVSCNRCESDCRYRGRKFNPGQVPYFRGY